MTAPIAPSPSRAYERPMSPVEQAQIIAKLAHWQYRSHLDQCDTVIELGRPCGRCRELLGDADDAGKAWTLAEEAEARATGLAAVS